MKVKDIRNMSDQDLVQKINDLKQELFNLRFQNATGQLENVHAIGNVKRDIARVKTIQRQRELNSGREA